MYVPPDDGGGEPGGGGGGEPGGGAGEPGGGGGFGLLDEVVPQPTSSPKRMNMNTRRERRSVKRQDISGPS